MNADRHDAPRPGAGGDNLRFARALSRVMDNAFRVPGTGFRIGLDPLLGLMPGLGDVVGSLITGYFLKLAVQHGAPPSIVLRMLLNLGLDALLGLIPLLGDVLDAGWKANSRNLALLEHYLESPGPARAASLGVVALAVLAVGGVLGAAIWVLIHAFGLLITALA